MRRRPHRRPPTLEEVFLGGAFLVLALSIAWGTLAGSPVARLASDDNVEAIKSVYFPAAGDEAQHGGLETGRATVRRVDVGSAPRAEADAAEPSVERRPKAPDHPRQRRWGTAP